MVVVRCVKKVMSTNGFTNMKMGIGAAGNQIGAGIAGGANAVNNTAARGLLNMGQTTGKQVNSRLKGKEAVADSLVIVCHSAKHLPAGEQAVWKSTIAASRRRRGGMIQRYLVISKMRAVP